MASFEAKRAFSTLVLQCQSTGLPPFPERKKSVWGVPERDTRDYQQSPEESLAETFARALGISTDELKKWLMELEHGYAALRRREARGEA